MARAKWTVAVDKRSTDTNGVMQIEASLLDNGVKQATLAISVTPDRALRVVWANEPNVQGLSGFEAWEKA